MGAKDLTAYSPRLLLQWEDDAAAVRHRAEEGSLVFADVSGFTRLSERLARAGGRAGAEEMGDIINALFDDLLTAAALRGGEMLKYGGDAVLLFFRGDGHAERAVAGAHDMQRRLRDIGRVETRTGAVRLRMSVGVNTGTFDLFKVGRRHQELIVAGPATTQTLRMEAAADAGEILLSPSTAAAIDDGHLGAAKDGGRLLRRAPAAGTVPIVRMRPSPHAERFVSADLGRYLGGDVEADHRLVTIAFVHVMGIDTLLPEAGPEQVAAWLDDTLTTVQVSLEELGVTFLATDIAPDGTKVMAAAGAPLAGEDAERRMLLALRRIVDAKTPLPVRAGVNRGHVFAAPVGPPFRQTYTTIGDVTNTAARLMGRAGAGEILALRSVIDHARDRFDVVELPPFAAKGKAEPLVPYRVDGEAVDAATDGVARLPLTGRDLELETLLGAAASVRDGTGALVELVGDMGAGKSRLVEELLSRADDLRPLVVRCEPYERTTPFHPIKRLLRELVPTEPGALAASVQQRAPALVTWLPLVGAVLDIDMGETEETSALDARFRLERTAAATVELLRAVLTEPTAIVVEDIHWLDDASAAVLRQIERCVADTAWLVCLTCRNEPSTFVPVQSESSLVQLAPLGDAAMAELIGVATADGPLPPHRRDALVRRAAGNPLFLTELLDHGVTGDDLPDSVEAVMAAQIDRLPSTERRLFRHAAVLGSRFDVRLLAEIADEPSLAAASARAMAARLQWLVVPDGPGRLRFRHQLVRDVAYEALPFRVRRELHDRAGDAIERAPGDAADRAGILSLHFLHARRYDACWKHALIAAQQACEKYANVEAVELFERALTAAKHLGDISDAALLEVCENLAVRQSAIGNAEGAKDALRRARRHARNEPVAMARLCNQEARIREREGSPDLMFRWMRRGLKAIRSLEDRDARAERAELLTFYGWAKQRQGRPREARRWAMRALLEAEAASHAWAIAGANLAIDGADVALGLPRDPARCERALAIYQQLGKLSDQAMVFINLGSRAYQQAQWQEALELNIRGRDLLRRAGGEVEAAYGSYNIAEILIDQGHLDEAERILDEVDLLWRSVGHPLGAALIDSHRGRLLAQRGEHAAALSSLRSAEDSFLGVGLDGFVLDVRVRAAECLIRSGELEQARRLIDADLTEDAGSGGASSGPLLRRVQAYLDLAAGDLPRAAATLRESAAIARKRGASYDVLVALENLSELDLDGWGLTDDDVHERDTLRSALGVSTVPALPSLRSQIAT